MLPGLEFRFTLEKVINTLYLHRRGRLPELQNPRTYSDKIQWLKLHDQRTEQVLCSDKLQARTFVSERIGKKYLLDLHHVSTRIDDPQFGEINVPFMLKTNHDSGSVYPIHNRHDLGQSLKTIGTRIQKPYGILTGEWAYFHIKPLIFAETMMTEPTVDCKFHCCDGVIKWAHMVSERATGSPKMSVVDADGRTLPLSMDSEMEQFEGDLECLGNWQQMAELARELSRGFRYVRIDLYSTQGLIYFSEMTFWPMAGFASVKHDSVFGEMLDIDLTFKRPPIHSEYRIARHSKAFREIRRSDLYRSLRPRGH